MVDIDGINNKMKYKIILYLSIVIGAYFAGMYQGNDTIKRDIQIVEKEILIDRDVVRYITRKDGTKEVIVDKSKQRSTNKEIKLIEQIPVNRKWLVGLSADISKDFKLQPNYILSLDHKIFKNIYVGAYYSTDHSLGVSVKISF